MTADTDLTMAAVARLLSLGFLPPRADVVTEMGSLAAVLEVMLDDPGLREAVAGLRAALPEPDDTDALRAAHHGLFGGTVACPPYETSYAPDPFQQARQMSDIAGFYAAFGAEPSGAAAERPDQIGCELEFLAFLALRREEAREADDDETATVCEDAEEAFLRDHLGRWLGPFCRELERAAEDDAHRALARLGQRYAVAELGRRGLRADPVLARRIHTVVEGDTMECGAEGSSAEGVLDGLLGGRNGRRRPR
jgi:TorA maturation chaperone TorD